MAAPSRPRSGPFGPGLGWLGLAGRSVSGAFEAHPLTKVGWGARSGLAEARSGSRLTAPIWALWVRQAGASC